MCGKRCCLGSLWPLTRICNYAIRDVTKEPLRATTAAYSVDMIQLDTVVDVEIKYTIFKKLQTLEYVI